MQRGYAHAVYFRAWFGVRVEAQNRSRLNSCCATIEVRHCQAAQPKGTTMSAVDDAYDELFPPESTERALAEAAHRVRQAERQASEYKTKAAERDQYKADAERLREKLRTADRSAWEACVRAISECGLLAPSPLTEVWGLRYQNLQDQPVYESKDGRASAEGAAESGDVVVRRFVTQWEAINDD